MINNLYNHCQKDPNLKAVCNHLQGAIRESRLTSAQAALVVIAALHCMILDALPFRDCWPLRATLLSTPFVDSSLFGGQFQSSVEEATRSQEKLSQVRRLASASSRSAQGTSGSRATQQSQKHRAAPPPLLLPLQPLSRFLQGMEVWLPKGAGLKIGLVGVLLSLRLSRVPGSRGSPTRGLQLVTIDVSIPSPPPIPPNLGEGVDGSIFLDIPGLIWDTQLGIAQKGLFPVGVRLSFFLPAWQRITSDQFVLKVIRQGYSLPFVRSPPLSLSPVGTPLPKLQCK